MKKPFSKNNLNVEIVLAEFFTPHSFSLFYGLFGDVHDLMYLLSVMRARIWEFVSSKARSRSARVHKNAIVEENVYLGNGTVIEPFAYVKGPSVIGDGVVIRKGAYIREWSLIDHKSIIGNAVEVKESIIMPGSSVPHLSYVGNSVIGSGVLLGAGTKTANEKLFRGEKIKIFTSEAPFQTELEKFGCIVGDDSRIGCGVTVAPGSIIGREVVIYPMIFVRGFIPHKTIVKTSGGARVLRKN